MQEDFLTLWELKRASRTIRCLVRAHPQGLELRMVGDGQVLVWSEVFASYTGLVERARAGRVRLESNGWSPPVTEWPLPSSLPEPGVLPPGPPVSALEREPESRTTGLLGGRFWKTKCGWCGSTDLFGVGQPAPTDFSRMWRCGVCNRISTTVRWGKVLILAGMVVVVTVVLLWR